MDYLLQAWWLHVGGSHAPRKGQSAKDRVMLLHGKICPFAWSRVLVFKVYPPENSPYQSVDICWSSYFEIKPGEQLLRGFADDPMPDAWLAQWKDQVLGSIMQAQPKCHLEIHGGAIWKPIWANIAMPHAVLDSSGGQIHWPSPKLESSRVFSK